MLVLLVGIVVIALSGFPGLLFSCHSPWGQRLAAVGVVVGSLCGLSAVACHLMVGGVETLNLTLPTVGKTVLPLDDLLQFALDDLSALFLLTIFFVPLCGSIYGLGYWPQAKHPQNGQKLRLFYGLLPAGMAILVIARHTILFLFGWEIMALAAYFLVATEDHDPEVRSTSWIYLAATHTATLTLFGLFGLLRAASGSFQFAQALPATISPTMATAIFVAALVGFGFKAGIMPLHFWLPGAHAMAPSHVSAVMSGVIIKMGVYGLVRVTSMLPHPPLWWGGLLLVLGVVSGLLGIAYALGQHDLKRLLAYSSIENIGVIFIGLGLAMIGRCESVGRADLVVLGLAGALLHTVNHGLFKSLLFFAAGAIIHAAHTRRMDHLGGLAKQMPATAFCFLMGAIAVGAMPPLNGFISELFIYLGMFGSVLPWRGASAFAPAAIAAPALAMIGALAIATFANAFGMIFLGGPRTSGAAGAHESPRTILQPMFALALGCLVIGTAPLMLTSALDRAVIVWMPALADGDLALTRLVPLREVCWLIWILCGLTAFGAVTIRHRMGQVEVGTTVTWGCGYAAPTTRMQYTPSSLAQMLVGLFDWALRPRRSLPDLRALFPGPTRYASEIRDLVLDRAVLLGSDKVADWTGVVRRLQQGSSQAYLLYIFVLVVVLFLSR